MKSSLLFPALVVLMVSSTLASAQGPGGKSFGFGIILGDPIGGTINVWFNRENSLDAYIGGDFFGAPRIGADYLWHFDAFRSSIAQLYAGPGLALGIGTPNGGWFYHNGRDYWYYRASGVGLGVRAIFGVDIIPRRTPLEIFFELGPLIGISPGFGATVDVAFGVRFYP